MTKNTENNHVLSTSISTKKSIRMIFSYAWLNKKEFILMLVFMGFGIGFMMVSPQIFRKVINLLENNDSNATVRDLLGLLGLGVGIALIGGIILGIGRYYSAIVGTEAQYNIRKSVYNAINRQTYSFFNKAETGDLVARATSDIEMTTPVFNQGITLGFQSIIMMIGVVVGISVTFPSISWIIITAEIIFLFVIVFCAKKMQEAYLKSRRTFGNLTTVFRENIIGAQVVRIFNSQNKEIRKFQAENADFKDYTIQAIKWSTILRYSGWIMLAIMSSFILVFGGWNAYQAYLANDQSFNLGVFVAMLSYISMLGMPINQINNVVMNFVQANAAMVRVKEVLDSMPEIVESPNAISAKDIRGDVEFRNVNFGYTSTLVLKNINLKVKAGTTVALLGTTGSGKSTLISLLPRFYDILDGELLIDGRNIKDYKIDELRRQIAVCSQNIFLFNISIADNIRYGRDDASLEEVIEAAKAANVHEFIENLPDKYDTLVGERGVALSGGQKQRVAIARALILKPKILILDDSTSSVDMNTEYKIQQALERVMKNRTTFIITQRLSTIRNANSIVVMDQGRIVGAGTHEDLIGKNAIYTQIYQTLFAKQKTMETPQVAEIMAEKKGGN
ncbi:MAG: ABC transporter ATP-binding protein/permease [Candidatus Lokiarchaeota archaeon]|nr:ABC transporter ATP-binding protein/permease [Candidatus Harpocratesius repetitus]